MSRVLRLIISLLICFAASAVGSVFTTPAIPTWYAELSKPSFSPPNWLFGPVWTLLYSLMAISFFLVWEKIENFRKDPFPLGIFLTQLALNSLWSVLFFGLKNPFYAFIDIIVLWVAILLTIITFSKISKKAGLLLIPYLLWVSFATILNFSIFQLK